MKWIYILFYFNNIILNHYNLDRDLLGFAQLCRRQLGKLKRKFDSNTINYRTKNFESVITNRGDFLAPIFGDMNISIVKYKLLRYLNIWKKEGDNKFYLPKLYECEYGLDKDRQINYVYYAQSAIKEDLRYEFKSKIFQGIKFKQQYFPVRYRKYRDLFLSLRELHNQGIVHGNITPEIILSNEELNIKGINYYNEHDWDFYIGGYEYMKTIGEPLETQNIFFHHPYMKIDNSARPEYDIYMLSLSILVIESYRDKERDQYYMFKNLDPYSVNYFDSLIQQVEDLFLIQFKLKTNEGTIQQFSECRNLSCFLYFALERDINKVPTAEDFRKQLNELVILHDASHELKRVVKAQADITRNNDDIENLDLDDTDPFNITMFIQHQKRNKIFQLKFKILKNLSNINNQQ